MLLNTIIYYPPIHPCIIDTALRVEGGAGANPSGHWERGRVHTALKKDKLLDQLKKTHMNKLYSSYIYTIANLI